MSYESRVEKIIVELVDEEVAVLPVKWVLVAEYLTEDGSQYLAAVSSSRSTVWDRMGMLDYALECERVKADSE